jgi:hypothetical protein
MKTDESADKQVAEKLVEAGGGEPLPQRKRVPPGLIFVLQVAGLVALGFVAARVGPKSLFDPAPTLRVHR